MRLEQGKIQTQGRGCLTTEAEGFWQHRELEEAGGSSPEPEGGGSREHGFARAWISTGCQTVRG